MAKRLSVLAAAFSATIAVPLIPAPLSGAERQEVVPAVDNARFRFEGKVNSANVNVRSGPGETYYETDRLPMNSKVTIVGHRYEWLKIVPPEGSFSLVAKASVTKNPDGRTATVHEDGLSVRAGSKRVAMKTAVQCRLPKGAQVELKGEVDEYFQIVPPADAYLFINEKFVTPVRKLEANEVAAEANPVPVPQPIAPVALQQPRDPEIQTNPAGVTPDSLAAPQPDVQKVTAAAPTTRPTQLLSIESEFDRLDAEWNAALGKSIEDLPTAQLLAGYESLLKNTHLPISMRRISEVRVASLRIKHRAKEEFVATMRQQEEAMKKIEALRAQRQVIEQRLESGVMLYTAVGALQPSTLQLGKETLYRLTDPETGRSLCYVRSDDARFVTMIGRFVGVKGDIASDPQLTLKVVTATDISIVDPERVSKGISAHIAPPSLTTGAAARTTEAATTVGN